MCTDINTYCNPHAEGQRFLRHAFPGCIAFWQLWGPVNTPITNVIMTLLRYWTTRSFCWTKTGLSPPPGRSWHNPNWKRRYVYMGRCPAHLLCPGRWGAQGAMFPSANRGGVLQLILTLYTINTHNMPRWATPWAKATQRTQLLDTEIRAVKCFFHLLMFRHFLQSVCVPGFQCVFSI